jgi:hypothetical protein
MTAREFWKQLQQHEQIEFLRMRAQQYPQYNDQSKYQFIDGFMSIWSATGRGQTSRDHDKV